MIMLVHVRLEVTIEEERSRRKALKETLLAIVFFFLGAKQKLLLTKQTNIVSHC